MVVWTCIELESTHTNKDEQEIKQKTENKKITKPKKPRI